MTVNTEVSPADAKIIEQIVDRIRTKYVDASPLFLHMDFCAVHNNTPLDLQAFLDADDDNFWHDARGITDNLDRTTGQLTNLFHPRFAKVQ